MAYARRTPANMALLAEWGDALLTRLHSDPFPGTASSGMCIVQRTMAYQYTRTAFSRVNYSSIRVRVRAQYAD